MTPEPTKPKSQTLSPEPEPKKSKSTGAAALPDPLLKASVDKDRISILNAIVGADVNQTPPLEHERYDFVNSTLHARFALATLKLAVENELPLENYIRVISRSHTSRVDLSFRQCSWQPAGPGAFRSQ